MKIPPYVVWPLVAVFTYGLLCFLASRSVFYPMKYPQGAWELQKEAGASDVWLETTDGVRLHAWWIPRPDAGLVTLFMHGNAGNLSHRFAHIREITAAGSSLLLLDYRGYGKSEGRPTERGLYADADAGYKYLVGAGHAPGSIVAHGESLGSAVAVDLAARHPVGGVVLEAPFTSARDVGARVLPFIGPLITWGWDSKTKIERVHAPVLIIHGASDEVIPFELGRALFNSAREPKSFWAVQDSGHNDIVESAGPAYRQKLSGFYAALRSGR